MVMQHYVTESPPWNLSQNALVTRKSFSRVHTPLGASGVYTQDNDFVVTRLFYDEFHGGDSVT